MVGKEERLSCEELIELTRTSTCSAACTQIAGGVFAAARGEKVLSHTKVRVLSKNTNYHNHTATQIL